MKITINESQELLIFNSLLTESKSKTYGGTTLDWLKKHKVQLDDDEKQLCKDRGAVWENGNEIGVHKGTAKDGTIVYFSYTHRAWHLDKTIKQAIKTFEFIKSTS